MGISANFGRGSRLSPFRSSSLDTCSLRATCGPGHEVSPAFLAADPERFADVGTPRRRRSLLHASGSFLRRLFFGRLSFRVQLNLQGRPILAWSGPKSFPRWKPSPCRKSSPHCRPSLYWPLGYAGHRPALSTDPHFPPTRHPQIFSGSFS